MFSCKASFVEIIDRRRHSYFTTQRAQLFPLHPKSKTFLRLLFWDCGGDKYDANVKISHPKTAQESNSRLRAPLTSHPCGECTQLVKISNSLTRGFSSSTGVFTQDPTAKRAKYRCEGFKSLTPI